QTDRPAPPGADQGERRLGDRGRGRQLLWPLRRAPHRALLRGAEAARAAPRADARRLATVPPRRRAHRPATFERHDVRGLDRESDALASRLLAREPGPIAAVPTQGGARTDTRRAGRERTRAGRVRISFGIRRDQAARRRVREARE